MVDDRRKRTFWLPVDIDTAIRKEAIEKNVRFSDIVVEIFRAHYGTEKKKDKKS
jgi:hypothetical protein